MILMKEELKEDELFAQIIKTVLSERNNFLKYFKQDVGISSFYYQNKLFQNPEDEEAYIFIRNLNHK